MRKLRKMQKSQNDTKGKGKVKNKEIVRDFLMGKRKKRIITMKNRIKKRMRVLKK